jgi:hypothetical protein
MPLSLETSAPAAACLPLPAAKLGIEDLEDDKRMTLALMSINP